MKRRRVIGNGKMCHNHIKQVIICIVLIIVSPALAGKVIYVDKNHAEANDRNPGTEVLPLETIDRAMAVVRPGGHVYVKGGTDTNDPDSIYDRSTKNGLPITTPGTADKKIIIEAYPGHTVILQGGGSGYGVALDHASYHEIRGFIFRNYNKASEGFATKIDILIENCEFTQTHETGLRLRSITNLTMRDVYVHHCFETGVNVRAGTNILFERVVSNYNSDGRGADGDGDGFAINGTENVVCIDCVAKGNSEDGFDLNCNGVFINCISQDHTACNVKLWRRSGDRYAPKKMDMINCVISGAGESGIKVSVGAELHLYNSVIYDNGEEGVAFRATKIPIDPVYSEITNTIIAKNGTYGIYLAGTNLNIVDADRNLYFQNTNANVGLRSDTNAVTGQDPLFFGPASEMFQLRDGSPAIDAGKTIEEVERYFSLHFTKGSAEDIDGACRPSGSAWDIGVDERVIVPSNTPPAFSSAPEPPPNAIFTNEGETLTLQFEASDPQANALVFFLLGGDIVEGMTIDSDTGKFSFTPTYDQGGNTSSPQQSYDVIVAVTDELFAEPADQTTVRIVVSNKNRPPSYDGLSLYTLVEGRPWMFGLPVTDGDGDVISYSAVEVPSQMDFDDSTGVIFWAPTTEQVGQHKMEVAFSDGAATITRTVTFEVLPRVPYTAPANEEHIFYVDASSGNNANNGQTEATAWKAIGKAAASLTAGQMVIIRSGVYYEEVIPGSGTLGQPIIYKAYPGERPVMDGTGKGSPEAFQGGSHLVYDGLTFRNYSETIDLRGGGDDFVIVNCVVENSSNYGIYAFAGDRLRVENVELRNIRDRGIYGGGTNVHLYNVLIDTVSDRGISMPGSACDNITIIDSEISHAGRYGVLVGGKNAFILSTRIHDNGQIGAALGAKRNFFVNSCVWNTSLASGTAISLYLSSNSDSIVLNSVLMGSARYGLRIQPGSHVYMRDSIVSNNGQQDFYAKDSTSLDIPPSDPVANNQAPQFTTIGDQSVSEKALLSFSITATDPDGDALTYSAISTPTGASFDPATQTFTWIPTSSQCGTYQVGFQVSDSHVTVSQTITITVCEPLHSDIGQELHRNKLELYKKVSGLLVDHYLF